MKKTIEVDSWDVGDLLDEAGGSVEADCTVAQLIQVLQRIDGLRPDGLDNFRLVGAYNDYDDDFRMKLMGDREETPTEKFDREVAEQTKERMDLLRRLADHHQVHRTDLQGYKRHDLIQARGWDKLPLEELRVLAAEAAEAGVW